MKSKFKWFMASFLTLLIMGATYAQEKAVSGTVTDQNNMPLPGVSVVVKGTSSGTQTDFDGNYTITAEEGQTLRFSYIGQSTVEKQVGADSAMNVQMEDDAQALEEVVVTGYGSRSRELSTSAVSTVSAEKIEAFVPSTSIDNILQGQAAGVQVTAANGRPGNTAFVNIRGIGSINAQTTPLYVIDGVPIPIDTERDFNPISNINPSDIESFSILKDAATVSKYGSRGANGVVLITTKQGKSGEAQIKFNSSYGFGERIPDRFELMDAAQKLELERQYADLGVGAATNLPGATSSPEELASLIALDTDWRDALLKNSIVQSNNLSISGGDDKLSYFLSLGYDKNTGIIENLDGFERVSARLNTTYQAKEWLSIGANFSVARSSTDLPRDRNNVQNPFRAMYSYNPYDPLFLRDDNGAIALDDQGNQIFNPTRTGFPIALAIQTEPADDRDLLLIGNLSANMTLTDKISNRFSIGLVSNRSNQTTRSISGGVLQGFVGDANFPGTQTDNFDLDFEYNVNNLLTYSDTFNSLHNVQASFLLEYNENIRTDLFATSRGFPTPDIPYQDVAAEPTSAGSAEARRILFSQGVFLDYDYDGKYILSGSLRRDGSSKFGPNNKYGYFYSASAGWNIANEDFMENSIFNTLKLRASYGTSGNQNIDDFEFLNLLDFGSTYNGQTTALPIGVGNAEIQWEAQATFDIGLEFGLFNNRLNGVVDYFEKSSDKLLLDRPISFAIGDEDNSIVSNIGEVKNSGIELSLNGDVVRTPNFTWSLGGNITFIDNEVVGLVDDADIITGTFDNNILRVGEEINSYFIVEYAGVDPATGEPLYVDLDGNTTNEYSDSFQQLQEGKSPIADFEGGFYTSFKYKGFGLRGDFVYKAGNYIINLQRADGIAISDINSNQRVEAFNYWRAPGDTDVLPSPLFQSTADQTSTRFLEKGDYIRLRTLTLDYTMPRELLRNIPINTIRLSLSGQNLFTITDFNGDPEVGLGSAESGEPGDAGFVPGSFNLYSYPNLRTFTFGLEVGF